MEKKARPSMAKLVLEEPIPTVSTVELQSRISKLKGAPKKDDAAWWNDLAGAYLRLDQPGEAVALLEPLVSKFPKDYGIHANLGTAYHLLGRYDIAEKHIKRDLEINTNAHFGLEVYHLALLQYLGREKDYQQRHLYVDEFTQGFLRGNPPYGIAHENGLAMTNASLTESTSPSSDTAELTATQKEQAHLLAAAISDVPPDYRFHWNLAENPKLEEGVRYMAELNAKQPACFVMLGVICLKNRDFNLAVAAFQRAIRLGSAQRNILESHNNEINDFIRRSRGQKMAVPEVAITLGGFLVVSVAVIWFVKLIRRRV